MSWTGSIFISLLTGILGLLSGGFIMNLCVDWYRVSSFEGKSGYAVIGVALLGGAAGLIVGLIVARTIAGGAEPSFLKGLGYASGAVMGIALGFARLGADFNPKMKGRDLELAIEIRCPTGFVLPSGPDEYGYRASANLYVRSGGHQPASYLRLEEATQSEGQWIASATIPLTTSSFEKQLYVRFDNATSLYFQLPLRSKPVETDMQWSDWLESNQNPNEPLPVEADRFKARYKVLIVEPAPPDPEPIDQEAAEFAALNPNESLAYCLTFFGPNKSSERNNAVAEIFSKRQAELAGLIADEDESTRETALLAVQYLSEPAPEIVEAVLSEGRAIADCIHLSNARPPDDPELPGILINLSSRFNHWKRAWWSVQQRLGLDGRPPIQQIYDLASVRDNGTAVDEIKLNASDILKELNK